METTAKIIEEQIKEYARHFLETEYGIQALNQLKIFDIKAVDAYDTGGVSQITDSEIKIAARRDINAGKLTNITKLIVRHELGHMLDENSPAFPNFEEQIKHEKIAWVKAKPKTPAEHWYKNISIRTHIDPLKMQTIGFPRPETKITPHQLKQATETEIKRMKKDSPFVDEKLAERFAMAHLAKDPTYYSPSRNA